MRGFIVRNAWFALLATGVLAICNGRADAQRYPLKPIEIIVPYAAGGSYDLTARVFARALQERWKTPVRVINQTGGNGIPGISTVMSAKPDGYTILMDGTATSSMLPLMVDNLPFKIEDRSFMALTSQTPMAYIVATASPFKTIGDVVARIKRDPSTFTWTSNGGVSSGDAAGRQLLRAAGVSVASTRPVIARGGAEGAVQIAGGHVEVGVASYIALVPFVESKKLRALAVAAAKRFPAMPDVPTTVEQGFPNIEVIQWNGFSGPPGMPKEIVQMWNDTVAELLRDPAMIKALAQVGLEPKPGDGLAMAKVVEVERDQYISLFR